jgi:hypothetical protein
LKIGFLPDLPNLPVKIKQGDQKIFSFLGVLPKHDAFSMDSVFSVA